MHYRLLVPALTALPPWQADAPLLYPLFGIGANLAATLAGIVLKVTTAARGRGGSTFVCEVQTTIMVVLAMAAVAVFVHNYIATHERPPDHQADLPPRPGSARARSAPPSVQQAAAELMGRVGSAGSGSRDGSGSSGSIHTTGVRAGVSGQVGSGAPGMLSVTFTQAGSSSSSGSSSASTSSNNGVTSSSDAAGARGSQQVVGGPGAVGARSSGSEAASSGGNAAEDDEAAAKAAEAKRRSELGLRESFAILAASLEIRCLAVMSLAQGLCTSLHEFAWKSHMRLLYPSPRCVRQASRAPGSQQPSACCRLRGTQCPLVSNLALLPAPRQPPVTSPPSWATWPCGRASPPPASCWRPRCCLSASAGAALPARRPRYDFCQSRSRC